MRTILVGCTRAGSVFHESYRPPFTGRSLCGLELVLLHSADEREVSCARCQLMAAQREVNTEQDLSDA